MGASLSVKRGRNTDVQFTLFLQKAGRLTLRVADPADIDDWIRASVPFSHQQPEVNFLPLFQEWRFPLKILQIVHS